MARTNHAPVMPGKAQKNPCREDDVSLHGMDLYVWLTDCAVRPQPPTELTFLGFSLYISVTLSFFLFVSITL